jgi:hypothetical protein
MLVYKKIYIYIELNEKKHIFLLIGFQIIETGMQLKEIKMKNKFTRLSGPIRFVWDRGLS